LDENKNSSKLSNTTSREGVGKKISNERERERKGEMENGKVKAR